MDDITFTTPSGYIVVAHSYLEYEQSLILQEVYAGDADVLNKTGLKLASIHASNRKAMEFLLVSVTDPKGALLPDPVTAVMKMRTKDGEFVRAKLDAITKEDDDPKAPTTT